jgi:hypothetical protein
VGELVEDDVAAVLRSLEVVDDVAPRQYQRAVGPRLARSRLVFFADDALSVMSCDRGDVAVRIDEHGAQ